MHINNIKISAFGLIEVMIAALILSISLLGVASLQSKAMYTVVEAGRLESAYQMLGQLSSFALTADPSIVSYMAYKAILNTSLTDTSSGVAACYNPPPNGCDQKTFYMTTVREWQNILSTMLPAGQGCTCIISPANLPSINMLIAINWKTLAGSYTTVSLTTQIPGITSILNSGNIQYCINPPSTTTPQTSTTLSPICNNNV